MRKRFAFWLNDKREDDVELNSVIDDLKRDRLFSRAIREGLRMWVESQSGENAPTVVKSDSGAGGLDLDKLATEIAERVAMLNGSMLQMQSIAPPATTGKQLGGFKALAPPSDDEFDIPAITTKVSANAGMEANRNFMQGLGAL